MESFVFIAVAVILYFLPVLVAAGAGKRNTGAIFVLNLLLGWTFIGWVVALVWAFTRDLPVPTTAPVQPEAPVVAPAAPVVARARPARPGPGLRWKA